ncbi:MAG TPA: glycoside hydrolase family 43 protein, partial [Acidimicrobiales bacterium]
SRVKSGTPCADDLQEMRASSTAGGNCAAPNRSNRAGRRGTARVLAVVLLVAVSIGVVGLADQAPATAYAGAPWLEPGKPYTQNFPDPTVVWDGSKYWAYGTSTGGSLMPAMSSTDLKTWIPRPAYSPNPYNGDPFFNDSFPVPPRWSRGGTSRAGKAQWGPGVANLALGWTAYTSWEVAPGRRCISAARSSSPAGPFTDNSSSPLVCDPDPGGSIDGQPFIDSNGTPYLLWKASGYPGFGPTRLLARQLSPDGMSFAPGSSAAALMQTGLLWEGNGIENPSMVKAGGTYWLIWSGNEWDSGDYRMGQARCNGPLGPCTRTSDAPILGNDSAQLGPGGGTLFVQPSGRMRIMYHSWNAPYTRYPSNPNCDGPGVCASQGQRRMRVDGIVAAGGRLTVDPIGNLEQVAGRQGRIDVSGWSLDPSTTSAISVHIYVDGSAVAVKANRSRTDVASAFALGTNHGFKASVGASPGSHRVCAYGIKVGPGSNSLLGCKTVTVTDASPFGSLDSVVPVSGAVKVTGWAIDPETTNPIQVHIYVDGAAVAVTANVNRPDVGAAFPYGSNHGYSAQLGAPRGARTVCAYAINVGNGSNRQLGCRVVNVP